MTFTLGVSPNAATLTCFRWRARNPRVGQLRTLIASEEASQGIDMFRHPRIERGNSGHGRPEDRTQRTSTSLELDAEDASHPSTVDSMDKTSPEAPQPGKTSYEDNFCLICSRFFTTQEDHDYHSSPDCKVNLWISQKLQEKPYQESRLFNLPGESATVRTPATSDAGQSGKV